MTSTFRLTRAEFKKIFKRPSVYIMALILLATIFISLYIFTPTSIPNPNVDYSENTSLGYYNAFYGDVENSKEGIEELYNNSTDIIKYYSLIKDRKITLNSDYGELIECMENIRNESSTTRKESFYNDLSNLVTNFYNHYADFEKFIDVNDAPYNHIELTNKYINHPEFLVVIKNITKDLDTLSPDNFIISYDSNNYGDKLKEFLDNGINFNITAFQGFYNSIDENFSQYSGYINKGAAQLTNIETYRKKMQSNLQELKDYFDMVVNFKTPIVLISEQDRVAMKNLIDEAVITIDLSITNQNQFSKQEEAYNNLINLKLLSNFENFISKIIQVDANNYLVNDLDTTYKKVNINRAIIIDKIDEASDDSSISNIQFAVTEYKLLATSFSEYTNDKIMLDITNNYDTSVYTAFANYDFKDFNKYQYKERLAKNTYYIDNNVYANSFNNNFALNQNSTTSDEPNAYDFIYFTMEICSVIIIVFAMMLMCNLITGETESGTIKLLIIRPYKRSKIITAKLFATLFFAILFLFFSFAIAFAGGYFVFGIEGVQPILAVFNATNVFQISPLGMLILNVLSLLLDIIFYIIIALLFAILFKNYAGAVTTSLVFVIIMFVLNLLSGGAFWYTLLPGMNLHLFKFFGNAFTPIAEGSILQSILITSIESSMTFVYSILMYLAYNIIFLVLAYSIFAKRDF